jgi:hypothetical protein
MKQIFTLVAFLSIATALCGQKANKDTTDLNISNWPYRKIIGFNMTPLVTQLIPFNRSNPREAGPFLMRFKRYNFERTRAFRFSMGLAVVNFDDNSDPSFSLNLAFGSEKRKSISDRWSYTKGFDFMILVGNKNIPGNSSSDQASIGVGPVWGIEYTIGKRITVGTEAALNLGVNLNFDVIINFEILPPVGIFLNYYL